MSRPIKPNPAPARPAPSSFPLLLVPPAPGFAPLYPHLANPAGKIECFNCKQPRHFAQDCPQPKRHQAPPAAAPVALNQGRLAAVMDTDQGEELVAYAPEQPSSLVIIASTLGASSSDAADVVDPLEYLHLAGMIGAIRSAQDDLEWVDRESNPGPQFRTGDIDDYSGLLGRWATVLQSMDFDIRHRKHKRHENADGLTQLHRREKVPKGEEVILWNEPEQEIGPLFFDIRHRKHKRHENADGLTQLHRREKVPKVPLINLGHWRLWRETFEELSFCLARVQVTWTGTSEHPTWIENPELLIIQAWRTNVEGDLLGFLFGSVRPGRCDLIALELIASIVQLADDLSPDIYFQSDDSPAPNIFERSLDPYLQWTTCLEEPRDEDTLPSRQEYVKPYEIIPHAFYPREDEVVIDDDEEEDDKDEETSEEGSYSEHSEGELSEGEEEEDPGAARKREEIATRKCQLEFASEVSLHVGSDPTRDPEPSKPKDGDPAAATSSTTQRKRSRSPSSSSPTHPLVRPRTDAGDRHSSSDAVPPTP
ncbi:hypothetical protein CBR_g55532 [Chara braunii]|uniref:CCHC-type domain-containing protein n=1 Tax=Chara braunii TaxID=69332 RepID=A0A388MD10_CHABU|nr:hypothetical protein CBR_g55532 [Chara braunii]|eukprot:GBG92451.1 hypothetical protein CBR_g55532 [Chara braunii]